MKPIVIRKMPKAGRVVVTVRIGHVLRWRVRLALWLVRLGLALIDWQLQLREFDPLGPGSPSPRPEVWMGES